MPPQGRQPNPTDKRETIAELSFPVYGLDLSQEFEQQRPATTPVAVNVRGFEALTQRDRGGSRYGLAKYNNGPLAGGAQVQIQDLNVVVSIGEAQLLANFTSRTGGAISVPWQEFPLIMIPIYGSGVQINPFISPTPPTASNWYAGKSVSPQSGNYLFDVRPTGTPNPTVVATMLGASDTFANGQGALIVGVGTGFYFAPVTWLD